MKSPEGPLFESCIPGKSSRDLKISTSPKFGKLAICFGENKSCPGVPEISKNSLF